MKRFVIFLVLFFTSLPAYATTYYIAPTALGDGTGSSRDNAMAFSAGVGFTTALAAASAGDHIIFMGGQGDYNFTGTMTINKSGSVESSKTYTVNTGTDVFTSAGHGYSDGDWVTISTTGTAPKGMPISYFDSGVGGNDGSSATMFSYIVQNATTDTFKLAAYDGGDVLDITTTGTGTQSVARINPIYIEGEGNFDSGTVFIGNKVVLFETGNASTGNTLFTFANGASYIKIKDIKAKKLLKFIEANLFQNNYVYVKDVFVDYVREAITVRGFNNCYVTDPIANCTTAPYGPGSHGWIVDNFDTDHTYKRHFRSEFGFNNSTFVRNDGNGRYITGDFPFGFHFGTATGSIGYYMPYGSGTGSAPSIGDTLTGATSGKTAVVRGVNANPILGGGVAGILQIAPPSGAFTTSEIVTNGTGFSATNLGVGDASATNTLTHNILVYDSTMKQFAEETYPQTYDNGDGFVSELNTHDIIYIRCKAFDTFDGGWDLKGWNHRIIDSSCSRDGQRCYRVWYGPNYLSNVMAAYQSQGDVTVEADGGGEALWTGGDTYIDRLSIINSSIWGTDTSIQANISYSSGNGVLPTINNWVVDQTTGGQARVIGYTGDGVTGTLRLQAVVAYPSVGNVITDGAFSATYSVNLGAQCPYVQIDNSLIYQDANHTTYSGNFATSYGGCTSSGSGNISCVEGGTCPTDPQFPNVYDKYWEGENNNFNPQNVAVQGITGYHLPVTTPINHTATINGNAGIAR